MQFGALTGFRQDGPTIHLDFESHAARVEVVTSKIIHIFCGFETEKNRSHAIVGDKTVPTEIRLERRNKSLWLDTGEVRVSVSDGFYVDFYDAAGQLVVADYRGKGEPLERASEEHLRLLAGEGHNVLESANAPRPVDVVKAMSGLEHFYGLGDKTGFLDKRGYAYEMWNTDNPDPQVDTFKALYKSIPFFITLTDSHVYGLFLDNTYHSYFDMAQESEAYYGFSAEGGNLDYYYIAGANMAEVVAGYTYLTGRCPLPQKWTLGYHQSRWGYVTQEDIQTVARTLREKDIPCDAIHFDIDYMDGYRVFTWNQDRYHGDPKGFLQSLAAEGFKPVVILDPGVKKEPGYAVYDEGIRKGYFAKTPTGETYVNAVWPGESVFPDFGRAEVRAWWGGQHRFLVDMGVRGIWNDMNEPASFHGPLPDDVVFSEEEHPAPHAKIHNIYGHWMSQATYEGMKAIDGRRPFVISRACYAGSQKYTTVWTGDNTSMWGHLQMAIPQLCNLGLSGMPFAGTDVGGFGGDTTAELLVRWVEVGCFSPLFRNHSAAGTRFQEPWRFGPEVEAIYRRYVKLRYRLIPYFYDLFREASETGAPVLRPLVYHYEKDPIAQTCNDAFMVGSQMLVAPVVHPGAGKRMVYLPDGTWYDYWSRERLTGPRWLIRDAPLDVCPIYVKAGSVLPMMPEQSYVGQLPEDDLLLDIFPGAGSWLHYRDDGESFHYRDGAYHLYRFTVQENGSLSTEILHDGYKPYQNIIPVQTFQP